MATANTNITVTIDKCSFDTDVVTSARSYQTEIMEQAKLENLIVCLPTGSGKTYIAVMLIKEMSSAIRGSLKNNAKRTIFLVKTVQLAIQQRDYIHTHTDLRVGCFYGELNVDLWHKEEWDEVFENNEVLVFTAQVFLNLIDHSYFPLKQVNLIIFDECHHATGDDQYASLMNKHYDNCADPPRILGLTASISSKKITPKKLFDYAKSLEKTYRARIEVGSSRSESIKHGTSVRVETIPCANYRDTIINNHENLSVPFEMLNVMRRKVENYLLKRKGEYRKIEENIVETIRMKDYLGKNIIEYNEQSQKYTEFKQTESTIMRPLKSFLDNSIEVGYELGIYGLLNCTKILRKRLKLLKSCLLFGDQAARELFDDIFIHLECLVNDVLSYLCTLNENNLDMLISLKVQKLLDRIIQQYDNTTKNNRCIVFVERIATASVLSKILSDLIPSLDSPWNTKLKVKHVTGTGADFHDKPMTAKYQRETIKAFRTGDFNILIATAVIEEGLDIPQCDLVIRFNKPNNFSSYMQSKGRARAKQNASYVLFLDQSNIEEFNRDRTEYYNYEEIETMIQNGFTVDENDEDLADDISHIVPYCPSDGIVIDATRAAQLIIEYCALLGNGQIFPPRFLFHGNCSPYTCILSMPANCPVRDDIKCEAKKKKLAKYTCCLEMVKKLHEKGEFNKHCLPNRNRALLEVEESIEKKIFDLVDELFEKKSEGSFETFRKQISKFPLKVDQTTTYWHLYQINDELGFIVPWELNLLPNFNIYETDRTTVIEIKYLQPIDYNEYKTILEDFCQYIFENAFDGMNINTILKFDVENSTFKLLPCLLTRSHNIDCNRMRNICNRKNQIVQSYSELNEDELYFPKHLPKSVYRYVSDESLLKRGSDRCEQKMSSESIETYVDYFQSKVSGLRIQHDRFLATMKGVKKARINYLKEVAESKTSTSESDYIYYPIEVLCYAPLNRHDYKLIYQLPSIFIRISQLYRTERLRKLLADHVQCYSFKSANEMPTVKFHDCLRINSGSPFLPLTSLNYNDSSSYDSPSQPSPDILFQAITRRSADENTDMENLEILGDCFLKLATSMCLYHRYPSASAGPLTEEKAKEISNKNLYRIAVQKRLKPYLNATRIFFRGDNANWIPPCYNINDNSELIRYDYQKVKRKAFADMIEAFIGVFLVSTDYTTTLKFMKWLGIDVIPLDENNHVIDVPSIVCSYSTANEFDHINKFYKEQGFDDIEKLIHYEFKNKAYLVAAFTHPSSFANRLTNCYERLEFLGDAVLDFLVTRYIFINHKDITPGLVTNIRQDLSNNGRLAYILVAYRLHTKILHNSPDLFGKISAYVGDEELFPKEKSTEEILNKEINEWADSTAPKALADVFEALVGAIFLDSGKSLDIVWNAIQPLLQQYLDRSIVDANLNPIRAFFERNGKVIKEYSETDPEKDITKSICIVETKDGRRFEGYGINKKMAKYDACRKSIKDSIANTTTVND